MLSETRPTIAPEIIEFYTDTITEADRLTTSADGRLELIRTQELLRAVLSPAPHLCSTLAAVPVSMPDARFSPPPPTCSRSLTRDDLMRLTPPQYYTHRRHRGMPSLRLGRGQLAIELETEPRA